MTMTMSSNTLPRIIGQKGRAINWEAFSDIVREHREVDVTYGSSNSAAVTVCTTVNRAEIAQYGLTVKVRKGETITYSSTRRPKRTRKA